MKRPLIGIVGRVESPGGTHKIIINEALRRSIVRHGGNPICLLLPQDVDYTMLRNAETPDLTEEEKEMILEQAKLCDGFLFPGGFKIIRPERAIMNYALENNKPILGICLGLQFLGTYGNEREQFLNEFNSVQGINHCAEDSEYVHYVTLDKNSKLYQIIGNDRFMVNSRHKYHLIPSNNYNVVGLSDDNIVEAIEFRDKRFAIGVQWHPEDLNDEQSKRLFEAFINEAKK